jgi:methylenetetrahydrofolate reductase (NADPH)
VKFDDEPAPGEGLPILPGHTSPGRFERILRAGKFAVTAEIAPPDSADPADVFARAALFDGYVDAINATDSSGANCHMSSMGICSLLTRRGYAMILQQSCRDRNRIAMQGDILGAAAMGVCNILCLSGDGVQSGDHPEAKPVFDMDSISALGMVRHMRDEQQFLSGRAISSPPRLFLGAAANPFAPPLDFRPHRMAKKIAAGAQFIQTQYCFDIERFKTFMAQVRDLGLLEKAYVLAGVGPLASAKSADWIRKNVAGVHIPDAVINRLAGAQDQKQEGVDLCIDLVEQVREIEGVSGVHIMAYRMEDRIGEIVTRSNVLDGREPWRPAA